jgi:hypothetical protein
MEVVMKNARKLTAGAAAAIAAGALLTGVAFAASDTTPTNDADDNTGAHGSAIAKLATTTTLTGEAKGDAISAAAQAMTTSDVDGTNPSAGPDRDDQSASDRDAHGDAVSKLATTTTLTGEAKGDAISALASSKARRTGR